ncbi:MAG TPA: MBL fold metallo-hydrolase [Methanocella sp.]|nr:MBL fold metallo-hydrolase [Methanocella sp.]
MKVRFLGTNGWFDSDTGNTICTLLEASDRYVVLDAGNGIHKLGRYVRDARPLYLFLSHFHLDHIEGLHTIVKFHLPQGLRIFGMEGTEKALGAIIRRPYTVPLGEGPYPVEVRELPRDRAEAPFLEDFGFLVHSDPCMGFRFRLDGKTIAYCTDTGACETLLRLGRDADLLITECSELSGRHSDRWPHLNPEEAVEAAKKAGAKRLALTHFNAHLYDTLEARKRIMERYKDITVAFDDAALEL